MQAITIPELYCPFSAVIHPQVEALGKHAMQWARHFDLIQSEAAQKRFLDAQYWSLIARAYPTAHFEDLALVNDWNCWGFFLDDVDDDSPVSRQPKQMEQLFEDVLHVLRGERAVAHGGPFIDGLRDVWGRIAAVTTPDWQARFRATLGAGLAAYRWEVVNRVRKRIPDREGYIVQRRQTGGWLTDVALVDVTARIQDATTFIALPSVQEMLEAANNTICWSNDLYSLGKEVERGDVHNLVIILQHEEGGTLQEAVEKVATLHDREVKRFEAIAMTLPQFGDERDHGIGAYADFCRAFMRGNIDWSQQSGRYSRIEASVSGNQPSYLDPIVQAKRPLGFLRRLFHRPV